MRRRKTGREGKTQRPNTLKRHNAPKTARRRNFFAAGPQEQTVTLAARHKLPAIYFQRHSVADGGLISYGSDLIEQFRGATLLWVKRTCGKRPICVFTKLYTPEKPPKQPFS